MIVNLAILKGITAEQQYNLQEHNQDLELDKLKIISNELHPPALVIRIL